MTDSSRHIHVKAAMQASTSDFTSSPTATVLLPRALPASLFPRGRSPIERDLYAVDGREHVHAWGAKDVGGIDLPLEFRGANSNSGGAVADWEAKLEQGALLASLFGAVATATANAATTCSGTAGATLTVVDGTDIPNLAMILFTTSTGIFVRQVVSGGGTTTLTLDRAASGTASGTVIRLGVYAMAPSVTHHRHLYVSAEGESWRRDYFGLAPSRMVLRVPDTGLVEFDSSWMPTDWSDVAEANPSFSAPTAGNPIVNAGGAFYIGETMYVLKSAVVTMDNGVVMRGGTASNAPNGVVGGVCARKSMVIEGELYVGNNDLSLHEIEDDAGTPALGAVTGDADSASDVPTTYDVSLQLGTEAGACAYLRLPAAAFRGSVQDSGGLPVVRFTARATGGTPAYLGIG